MSLLTLQFQQPCSVQWIQMGGVALLYFDVPSWSLLNTTILAHMLLSTTLSDQNACLKKRLLIVEAEWLTVNSTFICKSNDE